MLANKEHVFEGYLDAEQKFYDYGTAEVQADEIFDLTHTGMSFYDQFLRNRKDDIDYLEKEKNLKGTVEMMSPQEYYSECATKIFESSVENLKRSRQADSNSISTINQVIDRFKKRLPMPVLNYAEKEQEGLHRMYVAGERFGWDHKFPVLVIRWADEDRAHRDKEMAREKFIREDIASIVREALTYRFSDYDEFKTELQWQFDKFYNDDNVEFDVDFDKTGNNVTVEYQGVTYNFDMDSIRIEPREEDDIDDLVDDEDLEEIEAWALRNGFSL